MKFRIASRWTINMTALVLASGCSAPVLQQVTASIGLNALAERQQDKVDLQVEAREKSEPEKFPAAETASNYIQLIAQMQQKGLWFAALAHLDALDARWGASDESRRMRADTLRQLGMLAESEQIYLRLLKGSQAAPALHGLGLLAAAQGQYMQAVQQLEKARRLSPTDAMLLNDLAFALLHTDQPLRARIPLMQAAQLLPNHKRVQSNVALFLWLHGKPGEAQDWMERHQIDGELKDQVMQAAVGLSKRPAMVEAMPENISAVAIPEENVPVVLPTQQTQVVFTPVSSVAAESAVTLDREQRVDASLTEPRGAGDEVRLPATAVTTEGIAQVNNLLEKQGGVGEAHEALSLPAEDVTRGAAEVIAAITDAAAAPTNAQLTATEARCAESACVQSPQPMPQPVSVVVEQEGDHGANEVKPVASMTPHAAPGEATRALLRLQSSGEKASVRTYPVSGAEGQKIYDRYTNSYSHPIPERLTTTLNKGAK